MTRASVHEYAAHLRPRYRAATKGAKTQILNEFCLTTGLHRKAAIRLLGARAGPKGRARGRPRQYGPEVAAVLVQLWGMSDRMCGKLLVAVLPDLLSALARHEALEATEAVRADLLRLSASTIDRLLRRHRWSVLRQPQRRRGPASGSLKAQVPLRTWSEWKGVAVGSLQADLVLHCGESTEGFYLTTLSTVDVATGWSELEPVWGMGKERVRAALHHVRGRLPFPLRALHTDNGSEFINHVLVPWCWRERISLTRGRSYRKNDQAYVEQRNWLGVRRLVGYDRLTTKAALAILQRLYPLLGLQMNFFRPVRKLVGKERLGARVHKQYDAPRTPYQRLLASGSLTETARAELEQRYLALNPATLHQQIDQLLRHLWQQGQEERPAGRKLG